MSAAANTSTGSTVSYRWKDDACFVDLLKDLRYEGDVKAYSSIDGRKIRTVGDMREALRPVQIKTICDFVGVDADTASKMLDCAWFVPQYRQKFNGGCPPGGSVRVNGNTKIVKYADGTLYYEKRDGKVLYKEPEPLSSADSILKFMQEIGCPVPAAPKTDITKRHGVLALVYMLDEKSAEKIAAHLAQAPKWHSRKPDIASRAVRRKLFETE